MKTAARTLIFLKENGIDSCNELCEKSTTASSEFHKLNGRLKDIGTRQREITELQKQIGTYGKTRDTYATYKKSGWDKDFFEANRADITLHKAAKENYMSICTAKANADVMLFGSRQPQKSHDRGRDKLFFPCGYASSPEAK